MAELIQRQRGIGLGLALQNIDQQGVR